MVWCGIDWSGVGVGLTGMVWVWDWIVWVQGRGDNVLGLKTRVQGLINRVAKQRVPHVSTPDAPSALGTCVSSCESLCCARFVVSSRRVSRATVVPLRHCRGVCVDVLSRQPLPVVCAACGTADHDTLISHLREVVTSAERVQGNDYGAACVVVSWALLRALRLGGDGVVATGGADAGATASAGAAAEVGAIFGAVAAKYLSVKNSPLSSQVGDDVTVSCHC